MESGINKMIQHALVKRMHTGRNMTATLHVQTFIFKPNKHPAILAYVILDMTVAITTV